jgi:hypothetical protein
LDFFGVLLVSPRGSIEEGDQLVCILCTLGELFGELPLCEWGDLEYVSGFSK